VIRVRALRKDYPGGARAPDGMDLDTGPGEFVALIGSSGAGKSTLLRCLNGLIAPSAGEVLVDGEAVTGTPEERLRHIRARIGFVFQQFNLLRRLSVLENVLVGRLAHAPGWRSLIGRFAPADVVRAQAVLERVGLGGLADRRTDTLSGGQQQRVGIASRSSSPSRSIGSRPTSGPRPSWDSSGRAASASTSRRTSGC
jgi:phosphonate transport system ATP-binding protein